MFDTVFNKVTWDCHADGGSLAASLNDYKETFCPMFDRAYTALLEDLQQRGMLDTTLVVAMGEFGRTPQLNPRGGRDHWPGVWSMLFAGAGVRGGQVIGSSDRIGAEPKDRPVTPAEVAATVYRGMGVDLSTHLPRRGRPTHADLQRDGHRGTILRSRIDQAGLGIARDNGGCGPGAGVAAGEVGRRRRTPDFVRLRSARDLANPDRVFINVFFAGRRGFVPVHNRNV